jgi:hypothetical protein
MDMEWRRYSLEKELIEIYNKRLCGRLEVVKFD